MADFTINTTNIYLKECFKLARTMTFKLHEAAIAMNRYVRYRGEQIPDDMQLWKYYLNVSGTYHSIDKPIHIKSLDKQVKILDDSGVPIVDQYGKFTYEPEVILFSKDSWLLHPYTKEEYSYDTRRYRDLIQQYPDREPFIISSLFPAELQNAIDSPNGTILSYDSTLVEENEYTLIKEVQDFAYNFTRRWYNPGYAALHDMYLGTFYVLLHNAVYMKIVSARSARIHTDQVHSFHVNAHLSSYHWLGKNIVNLNTKQLHWLYRNIRYITKNAGQRQTFDWLVENLFKDSKIPLYEYVMKHVMDQEFDDTNFDGIKPTPVMIRRPLSVDDGLLTGNIDTAELLNKTKSLAKENNDYKEFYSTEVNNVLADSASDTLATKTLECAVDNIAAANLYTLPEISFTHWISYAAIGQYNYLSDFIAPKNVTSVSINSFDAAMIYIYCLFKVYYFEKNIKINHINLNGVYIPYMNDVDRLKDKISEQMLPESRITYLYSMMPQYETISNKYDFIEYCKAVKKGLNDQWNYYTAFNTVYADVALQTAMNLRQRSLGINVSSVDFTTLLDRNFIDIRSYNVEDYQALADGLQAKFIGDPEQDTKELRATQKSIIDVMLKLSSYSIQIADNTTSPDMMYIPTQPNKVLLIQHGGTHYAADYNALSDSVDVSSKHIYDYIITDSKSKTSVLKTQPSFSLIENDKYGYCAAGRDKTIRAFTALEGNSHFNTTENYGLAFYALSPEQRADDMELIIE